MNCGVKRICTRLVPLLAVVFLALSLAEPVSAQEPFYKGKLVRIVVGYAPGGGFDTFSRLLARHLKRHIPGNPSIIRTCPGPEV
jgi:tripartite-type tricarboxylate transporter receptor subunit TctC